ncbi:YlxR family protein [Deinococcus sp. QL22]|uniref:YlxR family protein n=1 Tax=Deinococcus sp. QL22 TaxID=2939437 RepID=UPI00201835CE|nr:YlxR family protein [Deinococcus sp. QL22]UQN06084.1 YlxR family protein [Deinococcus sp. QL22]
MPDALPTTDTLPRHTPERSCVACRRKRPQVEFVRVTRQDGVWAVQVGKRSGRGAYVCSDSPACWQDKKLRRAFGTQAVQVAAQLAARQNPPQS